ncbi:MAG TPA: hypothetical protein VGD68_04085 [Streptosporangiaceae bacterium]
MSEEIIYYAVVGTGRTAAEPSGLARRRHSPDGPVDESFTREGSWQFTNAIYQHERGENFGPDLVEISAEEAAGLVERFRLRWAE